MSDIYLQITETPTVVTLSAPVVSGALASTVTVANTVTVALDSNSLSALENVTVTVGAAITGTVTVSNFPATQPVSIASVTIGNTVTIAGTVTANPAGTQTIAGTVTANLAPQAKGPIVEIDSSIPADPKYMAVVGGIYSADEYRAIQLGGNGEIIVGSLPAISGTVTANVDAGSLTTALNDFTDSYNTAFPVGIDMTGFGNGTVPISGTVTANTFALQGTAVTTSNFTSTTASTVLANFNAGREVLTIFNEGAGNLFVCPGATCTTVQYQIRLSSGDYYEVPNHQTTITHSAVFATAGTARVTQVS